MSGALRPIARGVAVAGVVLAVLAVRVVTGAHTELRRGEQLAAHHDPDAAILAFRRAARFYAPGNPYSSEGLRRLSVIGAEAEREGNTERALAAYRAIHGAIMSARSVYVPHQAMLARADEAIARLTAHAPGGTDHTEASILAELRAPIRPHLLWLIVLLIGWLSWTIGAFVFAQRAIDEEDRLRPGQARVWGTVIVLGFGLFVIGMALA